MLSRDESEELTALREAFARIVEEGNGMDRLQAAGMKSLIALERKDAQRMCPECQQEHDDSAAQTQARVGQALAALMERRRS